MKRLLLSLLALPTLSLLAAACGDDTEAVPSDDSGTQTSTIPAPTMVAVYSVSRGSAQVAILNDEQIINGNLINSAGTGTLKLNAALSSNVTIARDTGAPAGQITLLDRTSSVLTFINTNSVDGRMVGTATVAGQLRVVGDDFSKASPQDVAVVSPTQAWVTRYRPNTKVNCTVDQVTDGLACGNDLLEYNPSTLSLTGRRVSFASQTAAEAAEDGTTSQVEVYARPRSVIAFGERLVVGLDYISGNYHTYGEGKLGLVDLSQNPPQTRIVDLSADGSSENCGTVRRSGQSTVLVSCLGDWDDKNATGGVYSVDISGDTPVVTALYEPRDKTLPPAVSAAEPIPDTTDFVAVDAVYADDEADSFASLNYVADEQVTQLVYDQAESGFSVVYEPTTGKLIYSDRADDRLGIFVLNQDGDDLRVTGSDKIGIPPRVLAPIPQ